MLNLVVGDVHVVPEELDDCERLLELVEREALARQVDVITFMGDQHNNHDVVSTRVMEFWHRWFYRLVSPMRSVVALVGNHDMVSPTEQFPHAMLAYSDIEVVGEPMVLSLDGGDIAAMPYYHDADEFVAAATVLHSKHPETTTLFCHQTFIGAEFENGWKPPSAVDQKMVPFKTIISGHIHKPQLLSSTNKVLYVGAPRWRTRNDAASERKLMLFDHDGPSIKLVASIPTGPVCSRIHCFSDSADTPFNLERLPGLADMKKDRVYVDVSGPAAYVRDREVELKAHGIRTRGFPDSERVDVISEAEGIEQGFARFGTAFKAPNGTDSAELLREAGRRLGIV